MCRVNVAARIVAQVEHDRLNVIVLDERAQMLMEVRCGPGAEAVDLDIADLPIGKDLAAHVLTLDDVTDDGHIHRRRPAALDRQHDRGTLGPANGGHDLFERGADRARTVDGKQHVAFLESGGERRVSHE